jgi:hypothetical protein
MSDRFRAGRPAVDRRERQRPGDAFTGGDDLPAPRVQEATAPAARYRKSLFEFAADDLRVPV